MDIHYYHLRPRQQNRLAMAAIKVNQSGVDLALMKLFLQFAPQPVRQILGYSQIDLLVFVPHRATTPAGSRLNDYASTCLSRPAEGKCCSLWERTARPSAKSSL